MRKLPVRWLVAVSVAVFVAVLMAGCGSSSDGSSTAESGSGEAAHAAYLVNAITDLTTVNQKSLEATLKEEGGSLTTYSAEFSPSKQLSQCQDAIASQRFNVLVITSAESTEAATCAKQAGEAGIGVVALEVPIGPSDNEVKPQLPEVKASVVLDGEEVHENLWRLIEDACKGLPKCQVALELASRTLPYEAAKLDLFEKNAAEAGDIEIVSVTQGNYEPSVTAENVPGVLAAHQSLNAYVFEADTSAVTAVPIVEEMGLAGKVKLLGEGGSRDGAKAIEEGKLFGSTGQFPASMAKVAAEAATELVQTGKVAQPAVDGLSLGKPVILTKGNIAEYTPQWGAKTE